MQYTLNAQRSTLTETGPDPSHSSMDCLWHENFCAYCIYEWLHLTSVHLPLFCHKGQSVPTIENAIPIHQEWLTLTRKVILYPTIDDGTTSLPLWDSSFSSLFKHHSTINLEFSSQPRRREEIYTNILILMHSYCLRHHRTCAFHRTACASSHLFPPDSHSCRSQLSLVFTFGKT